MWFYGSGVIRGRPTRRPFVLAIACGLLASCGQAPEADGTLPVGTSVQDVAVGDVERSYRVHRPGSTPASPALVLVLHGGGGSAQQAESSYGWTDLAEGKGFLVAHPQGLHRTWNTEGGCCGRAAAQNVDDVAFLVEVVEDVSRRAAVDADRVFVTGMSNGAMMSYRLACSTDLFAAIGPVAGTMLGDCAEPSPVSVLHVHGTADSAVRLDGEPGDGVAGVDGPPISEVIDFWRAVDQCLAPASVASGPVHRWISGCADGRSVELVTIDGAGHQWPGSEAPRGAADPPFPGLDATENIWRFFDTHPRDG